MIVSLRVGINRKPAASPFVINMRRIKNMIEEWMPIIDERVKQGLYEISNYGRCRNANTGQILKIKYVNGIYPAIALYTGRRTNTGRSIYVSIPVGRLVLLTFRYIPDSENYVVFWKDGNVNNNYIDNLEWRFDDKLPKRFKESIPLFSNDQIHILCKYMEEHPYDNSREVLCDTFFKNNPNPPHEYMELIRDIKSRHKYVDISSNYKW